MEDEEDKTIRVAKEFNNEIEEIQKERLKRLIDTVRTPSRKITSMIPKHKVWGKIKEDIINHKF